MAGKRYDSKHRVLYTGEDERPDGRYRFRTKIKGKTHVIYAQTLAELRQKEKEFEKMVESGTDIDKQNMTVNDFAELYLKAKKQTIQRTTFSVVNEFYNRYIKESIGKKVITSVKKSQVKSYYLSLVEKGLAISTLQRIDGILAPIFEMAVDDDVIIKNPARKVVAEIKKEMHARPKKKVVPTPAQMKKLIDFVKETPVFSDTMVNLVITLFGTGMRVGEINALTWDNVDFENNRIYVVRSTGYVRDEGPAKLVIKEPKSEAGNREIPMIGAVREALLAEKERQISEKTPQPTLDGVTDFCFLSNRNTVFVREAVNKQIQRMQDLYELHAGDEEKIPRFSTHGIRHVFATALCQSVDDLKAIQEIMGHADIQTTMNIYADATREAKEVSMEAFEEKIGFKR